MNDTDRRSNLPVNDTNEHQEDRMKENKGVTDELVTGGLEDHWQDKHDGSEMTRVRGGVFKKMVRTSPKDFRSALFGSRMNAASAAHQLNMSGLLPRHLFDSRYYRPRGPLPKIQDGIN